jgi:hypothetical protein
VPKHVDGGLVCGLGDERLPLRQWVATIPYELRPLAAAKPDVLAAIGRIFVETVLREQKCENGKPKAEGGAVCFVHRRLLGGELLAHGPRLDWARLLRRTLGFDPLKCPHCGHRLRAIADITERETIDRILKAVGYERRTGPRARAPARQSVAPAQADPS